MAKSFDVKFLEYASSKKEISVFDLTTKACLNSKLKQGICSNHTVGKEIQAQLK